MDIKEKSDNYWITNVFEVKDVLKNVDEKLTILEIVRNIKKRQLRIKE